MFLRRHRKHAAGETYYEYWTLCESVRTAQGPRQKVVATLGKLTGEEPQAEAGWDELEGLLEGRPAARQMELGPRPAPAPEGPRWELVEVRGVRVERARDFGEAFLGLALWRRLGLHTLLGELIAPGQEEVPWPTVASVLTVARFCAQRSELAIARALVSAQRALRSARGELGKDQRGPALSRPRRARRAQGKALRASHGALPLLVRRAVRIPALRRDEHLFRKARLPTTRRPRAAIRATRGPIASRSASAWSALRKACRFPTKSSRGIAPT